jgi:hypothetical protein
MAAIARALAVCSEPTPDIASIRPAPVRASSASSGVLWTKNALKVLHLILVEDRCRLGEGCYGYL